MRKFAKGSISTYVEDNDHRVAQYLACGWKEEKIVKKPAPPADERARKAISDVESVKNEKDKKRKSRHDDKQTNEALMSAEAAAAEMAPVDDGLFKKEDE